MEAARIASEEAAAEAARIAAEEEAARLAAELAANQAQDSELLDHELIIQSVSDYLWYNLDAWGRLNAASTEPQCGNTVECWGNDFEYQKCCAAISISAQEIVDQYIYRCIDSGLMGSFSEFNLVDQAQVTVSCLQMP